MHRTRLNEEEMHLYKDKKTGKIFYFDGKKLVEINSSEIRDAENKRRTAGDVVKETEAEREKRISNANASLSGGDVVKRGLANARSAAYRSRQKQREKEAKKRKEERDRQSGTPSGTAEISLSIKDFVADQIKERTKYSYSKFNKKYNNAVGSIIKPGRYIDKNVSIPLINVYFDQSGSWGESDIRNGNRIIDVLSEYVRQKKIDVDIYYFSNNVHENAQDARNEGGTYGQPVIEHILKTRPDNVIIMTDSDIGRGRSNGCVSKAVVPGGVWFIWRGGEKSDNLVNSLAGKKMTKEFNLG